MEDNNKFGTNAGESGSGSMPYGAGTQGQNPYGQPLNGGQQGQNPAGYGPIQLPPPVQGAPAAKPGKNKTGLVVGILCAAAVVLVIAAGVLMAKSLLGGNPEQQLAKGIANMAKEMAAYQGSVASDIGLAELNELKDTRMTRTSMDLSFTDPDASGSFSRIDVELDAVTDPANKMAECSLGLGAYGFTMDIGNVIAADNTLYVDIPLAFEDVYSIDLTHLGKDFNNSAWSALLGETIPEDYSLTLFPDAEPSDHSGTGMLQKILQGRDTVSDGSVQYETLRQKKEFISGGTNVECGGVRVTMDMDAYNESMEAMRDEFLASDYYADLMKGYAAVYADDFGEFEDYMEEFVETMFSLRLEQDFVMDVYLDKKGRIVNISTPGDIAVSSLYTELDSLAVDIDFAGTERTLDSVEGGIYVQSGSEILYMGISRTAALTEDYYNEDITLCIQSDRSADDITLRYESSWNYGDHAFDLRVTLGALDTSMEVSADGAFEDLVKGESHTLRISHSAVTVDGEDLLLLTGTIATEPADDVIETPDDAVDILGMSESDIMSLLYGYSSLY